METAIGRRMTTRPPTRGWRGTIAAGVGLALAAFSVLSLGNGLVVAQRATPLKDMGTVSGMVTAPTPFKAAHVYLRNVDKHIEYMVYTQAGAFRAVALFPGNYELVVRTRGLESEVQKLVVKAGDQRGLQVTLRDAKSPDQFPSSVDPSLTRAANGVLAPPRKLPVASYDEIYPPGPGKAVLEELCMVCHGENFFPGRLQSAAGWRAGLDNMMGKALAERDKEHYGEGHLAGAASNFRFGVQDRKDVLEYLTTHFGLDKKPRAVRDDKEVPIDEAQLGKAQFIEYYALGGPAEAQTSAPPVAPSDSESASGGVRGVRILMQLQIDREGNRWAIDRGVPSRLVKLDPRTGEQKTWNIPDPRAGVHDLIVDREGMVWVPEYGRRPDGAIDGWGSGSELNSHLLGFNPKTEKWEHIVDADPNDVIRARMKGPLVSASVDSKGAVWVSWMVTGAISRYEPSTKTMTVFRIPTPSAEPYGQTMDPDDNVWVSEWNGGKLGRYNPRNKSWTEFAPPSYPANFRRGMNADAAGNIWTGIWAAGKRPGKIAKLEPKTGVWTEWDIPHQGAQPYDASIDRDGNVWFPDIATPVRPTVIGRFNPREQTFTFYPRPQAIAESTRLNQADDGSVHYTPRYGTAKDSSGFGVLYPDKDKITTLAAPMLNGPPGYPFKVAPSAKGPRN